MRFRTYGAGGPEPCVTIDEPAPSQRRTLMRRMFTVVAALVAAACLVPAVATAQTLDEIIAMNLKAKGGLEKIRATSTVRMTGHVSATPDPSVAAKSATTTMLAKRPNKMRREQTIDGESFVSAF